MKKEKCLQFLNNSSNVFVESLESKLKVYTLITSCLLNFKSVVVMHLGKIMKIVPLFNSYGPDHILIFW